MTNETALRNEDMTFAACLLCGAKPARVLQRLIASDLQEAYRDALGIACRFPTGVLHYLQCPACDLRFFSPPVTGDEAFYGDLQKISWYYNAGKQEFKMAARYVDTSHRLLEIGAGRGLFAREIKPASYCGLEFSPSAIELAAKDGIRLLPQTIERHAQEHAGRYDVVCAFQVLEHVADPRSFLDAAARCLRDGGRLLISVPAEDGFAGQSYWDVLNMPPHHVTRWSDTALRAIARVCALTCTAIEPEPLARNMRRAFAQARADRWLATSVLRIEPLLLDQRLRRPFERLVGALAASALRRTTGARAYAQTRGHAVLAVFMKNEVGAITARNQS